MSTQAIELADISFKPSRLRALRPEVVAELAESIATSGLIQPIVVRPDGKNYWLIAGHHRLEAARSLQWKSISAIVLEGVEADQAELIEIDENLIRAELTPAERVLHVGRRKALYERMHPQTKHGGAPGAGRGKGKRRKDAKLASFQEETAKATGKSRRSVERDATRAKKVTVLADISGTSLDQGDEIDALAKLPEDEQRKLAERAEAGENVSAKARVQELAAAPAKPPQQPSAEEPAPGDAEEALIEPAQAPAESNHAAVAEPLHQATAPSDRAAAFLDALANLMPLPDNVHALATAYRDQAQLHVNDLVDLVDILTRLIPQLRDETTPPERGPPHSVGA